MLHACTCSVYSLVAYMIRLVFRFLSYFLHHNLFHEPGIRFLLSLSVTAFPHTRAGS